MIPRPPALSSASAAPPQPARSALCWLAALAALFAAAQGAEGQVIERPADEPPELPEFEPPAEREPLLPPLPPPTQPQQQLSAEPGVFVRGYRIVGSTVFSEEELQRSVAPWAGRTIRSEDLVEVRNALTELYIDHGYVNSGATLPDQGLEGGIVELRIVEGSLAAVRISGNEQLRDRFLRARIERGAATPLDVHELEERIEILQRDRRVRRVEARLAPGEELGEAILHLRVEEASRVRARAQFSNYEPASIGALAGRIEGTVESPSGWGDSVWGQFTISDGLRRLRGTYELPLTRWDTRLALEANYATAAVTEDPFDNADIESTFQSYQVGLYQPIYTSPRASLEVGVIGDWRRSEIEAAGEPFPFPGSGSENGVSKAAVLRFPVAWLWRDQKQVVAARSLLSWGIDALDATTHSGTTPDGRFLAWLLQLQAVRRFETWGIEAVFRADLQLANDALLTLEQFPVGGYATVRGYRQNQRVQDQGVVSSIEVRVPVWNDPERWGLVQLAPFFDYGRAWDHNDRPGSRAKNLASAGIGLRWLLPRFFDARIYWGQNLNSVETSGDLQDHGVQFVVTAAFP